MTCTTSTSCSAWVAVTPECRSILIKLLSLLTRSPFLFLLQIDEASIELALRALVGIQVLGARAINIYVQPCVPLLVGGSTVAQVAPEHQDVASIQFNAPLQKAKRA